MKTHLFRTLILIAAWTIVILAWIAPLAHGQTFGATNPCGVPVPPGVVKFYTDTAAYSCAPGASPTSTALTVRANGAGAVAYWHCKAAGAWHVEWAAATWAFLGSTAKASDAMAILASPAPLATLNAIAATYPHVPLADPSVAPVWCPVADEMWAATPPADPPPVVPPAFIVAPNGTAATRPAFAVTNGVREFGSYSTAPVGAACDCSTKMVEGQITFCRVNPPTAAATLVASCVKAP